MTANPSHLCKNVSKYVFCSEYNTVSKNVQMNVVVLNILNLQSQIYKHIFHYCQPKSNLTVWIFV